MSKILALLAVGLVAAAMFMPQLQESVSLQNNAISEIPSWVVQKFMQYKATHNKVYTNMEEEIYRMALYYSNLIYIQLENARQSEYVLGENQFMDISQEEFAATFLTTFPENYEYPTPDNSLFVPSNDAFAWGKDTTGNVLNQGSCGSCWAFSAAEVVQSFWKINKGSLPYVSEQQLVDCSRSYGNQGCNGGWPSWALNYVKANGLTTTAAYPYTGRDGTCKINSGEYKIGRVQTNAGCPSLQADIKTQPTSVAVDASNWSFYKSGVFSNCGASLNHAVLAYGWDASGNWLVQNSWGTTWGAGGYITLKTGNTCGVCNVLANAY